MTPFIQAARKLSKERKKAQYDRFKKRLLQVMREENKKARAALWRNELRHAHGRIE